MSVVSAPISVNASRTPSSSKRLLSLDVLRGITIAFMIMVNNNGGPAAWNQMQHADWNGFTATDLVFPTFLFVVGVSIVFAYEGRLANGATRAQLAWHTVKRAFILFASASSSTVFPTSNSITCASTVCCSASPFAIWSSGSSTFGTGAQPRSLLLVVVLVGYWILVRWVPVPGAGVPGRDVPFLDKDQNIVAWVDRHLMPGHLYEEYPTHNTPRPGGAPQRHSGRRNHAPRSARRTLAPLLAP